MNQLVFNFGEVKWQPRVGAPLCARIGSTTLLEAGSVRPSADLSIWGRARMRGAARDVRLRPTTRRGAPTRVWRGQLATSGRPATLRAERIVHAARGRQRAPKCGFEYLGSSADARRGARCAPAPYDAAWSSHSSLARSAGDLGSGRHFARGADRARCSRQAACAQVRI